MTITTFMYYTYLRISLTKLYTSVDVEERRRGRGRREREREGRWVSWVPVGRRCLSDGS